MSDARSQSAARIAIAVREARSKVDSLNLIQAEPLAIIGMACRFPGGIDDPAALWNFVRARGDAVATIPGERFDIEEFSGEGSAARIATREAALLRDIDRFDAQFFGIAPREAAQMDPQQRLLLEVSWEALDDAGQLPERLRGSATGVFTAVYNHDYLRYQHAAIDKLLAYTTSGTAPAIAAGRVSFLLDLRGPAIVIDTACSSSLVAAHLACTSLRNRESNLAIVAGAGLILGPETFVSMSKWGMLAPDGRCKSFDARANGFGRGEGCGVMVIKRLADALRDGDRVRAVIRGTAVNQDGRSTDLTAPNGLAQQDVIRRALGNGRVEPRDVTFIEAHGTGTSLGDPIEVEALAEVLGAQGADAAPCALSSVKANIGHLEAAAGIAGLIKATLALEHATIPPQALFESPNPHLALDGTRLYVPTQEAPWPRAGSPRFAGVSSFGFSGTNAHVVLEEAPQLPSPPDLDGERDHLLVFSARDAGSLGVLAARYAAELESSALRLEDVCFTAATRRVHFEHRMAVAGRSATEMAGLLRDQLKDPRGGAAVASGTKLRATEQRPVFVFSGQGPQSPGMGLELYGAEPAFRRALDECDAALRRHSPLRLLDELAAQDGASRLGETEVAQPALFAIQVAIAALWRAWGIRPAAVVGHSVGEIAAAHVCGALTLEDAVRLVAIRGRLMQRATGTGRMAAIELPAAEVQALLGPAAGEVVVAAENAPDSCVIAGTAADVEGVVLRARQRGAATTLLPVDYAFHSPQMEPFCVELEAALAGLRPSKAELPMSSSVTGELLSGIEVDAAYWRRNMRQPVRFASAVSTLVARGYTSYLEISPHPVLSQSVQRCAPADSKLIVVASQRRGQPQRLAGLRALGSLYVAGHSPEWAALHPRGGRVVSLPRYAWKDQRFPVPRYGDVVSGAARTRTAGVAPLLGPRLPLALSTRVHARTLSLDDMPFLGDHRIGGQVVVPAAALVEMALECAGDLWGDNPCRIDSLTIDRPMLLAENDSIEVQVIAEGDAADRLALRICSRAGGAAPWIQHAEAQLARGTAETTVDAAESPAIPGRCSLEMDARAFYEMLERIGPEFGPSFRRVERAWLGRDECWAQIGPAAASSEPAGCRCPPTFLDACFQSVAGALGGPADGAAAGIVFVPVGIDRIDFGIASGTRAIVRARVKERTDAMAKVDLTAWNDDGRRLASIEGMRTRGIARASIAQGPAGGSLDANLHELVWRRIEPAPGPASVQGRWLILRKAADIGDTLAELLARLGAEVSLHGLDAPLEVPRDCAGIVLVCDQPVPFDDAVSSAGLQDHARALCLAATLAVQTALRAGAAPRFVVVTRGAQAIAPQRDVIAIAHAALWGWRNSLALEHPELCPKAIDLDPDARGDDTEWLAREVATEDGEDRVACRAGIRYVARLERVVQAAVPAAAPTRLRIERRGTLDQLAIGAEQRRAPGPGEVEIRVEAAGLNFRDVMNALGTYPGDAGNLGDECAGVVVSVGAGVTHLAVGDEVMAFLPGTFASHVTGDAAMVVRRPRTLTAEQAACVPIVFLTASLALERIARLRAGQRALIHAGAGGVGLAAIQLALRAGAEVFATAGSEEKRRFLASLGVRHVMDSRSLAFAREVQERTNGEGVDVVLNSLAGDFIPASLGVLKVGGHFLEIGRTGIWSAEQVAAARPGAIYTVIFLGRDREAQPQLVTAMLAELAMRFANGDLVPPPVRVFDYLHPVDAFRHMAQSRHIGKIALRMPGGDAPRIRPDATYLVTGAFGGIGRVVVDALRRAGANSLLLVGRSAADGDAAEWVAKLRSEGATVSVLHCDIGSPDATARLVETLGALPALAGIVHSAGAIADGPVTTLDAGRLDAVMGPKIAGSWNLHRLALAMPVDFFVCFSAGAALLGSAGQANYTAANAAMDAIVRHRDATGHRALSIQWGGWSDAGMIARLPEQARQRWQSRGMLLLDSERGARQFIELLGWTRPVVAVLPAHWSTYAVSVPQSARAWLKSVVDAGAAERAARADARSEELREALASVPVRRRRATLCTHLEQLARRILGVGSDHELAEERPLRDLGLDSLMAVELRNSIGAAIGRPLPATLLFDFPSIAALADHLLPLLGLVDQSRETTAEPAATRTAADEMEREIAAMSDDEAEAKLLAELGEQGARTSR
ncbi:MAG: type I polyketide synthase [Steroidobacteraceae bacterium]